MFQERDGEKEILLGNKQLLGIFFVLAILFGVFFTAGYMVGHTTRDRRSADSAEAKSTAAEGPSGGETHDAAVGAGETLAVSPDPAAANLDKSAGSAIHTGSSSTASNPARKAIPERTRSEEEQQPAAEAAPAGHNTYLQVAALNRSDAEAVAKVLSHKGFHTHIAPKPGTQYFRVLVGPVKDAGDLNATRDALKTKGFREVFVQHL